MIKAKPDRTKTLSVPEAGRIYFDLGMNASYEAAKRGDIPTIKIGGKIRALVPAIERMLEQAGKTKPAA
jgi:hypothetical protein